MKKTVSLLLVIFLFLQLKGQIIFNSYVGLVSGYTFTSFRDSGAYYDASLDQSLQYGFDVEYKIDRLFSTGITYLSQNTTMPVKLHWNGNEQLINLNARVRWVLFGGTCLIPTKNTEFFFCYPPGCRIL